MSRCTKFFSTAASVATSLANSDDLARLSRVRNIGISAHIDSGKTTLTERILFYTGRIGEMHEVKGRDGIGATMDSMDLEREKGITIQSAATHCNWALRNILYNVNIIDTPGHVDFTVEVERALRVLDGAVLVVCGVSGVQSQTITVDRQMKRYQVPRVVFVNKLDRMGASPDTAIERIRNKLKINAVPLQLPLGLEGEHRGILDVLRREAVLFEGSRGETVTRHGIPAEYTAAVEEKRKDLIESLAEVDDEICERFVNEAEIRVEDLERAIRRATISRTFVPVFMGSAFKNVGVQTLLDGVVNYLPAPNEVKNYAIDVRNGSSEFLLGSLSSDAFVGLAFKLEDGRFGQLTYVRVYQGFLQKGTTIVNARTGKRTRVPRLVRMHSSQMEDVDWVGSGEICALFGIDCASGDTFTAENNPCSLSSIHVPAPVISLAIKPKCVSGSGSFMKAIQKFVKEDPTFHFCQDPETNESIISGMGELHLEIYVERMRREFGVECIVGKPQVSYRETIGERAAFDHLHKKQTGGAGQYARVIGYIEPVELHHEKTHKDKSVHSIGRSNEAPGEKMNQSTGNGNSSAEMEQFEKRNSVNANNNEFINRVVGGAIPTCFIPAVQKGFNAAAQNGCISGHPMIGVRYVLEDGQAHVVDSSELAFRIAAIQSMRQAVPLAKPIILEPIMKVVVCMPVEFQGSVLGALTKRRAIVADTESGDETVTVIAEASLNGMFGWASELRSLTQGKGEFTMEYLDYRPVLVNEQLQLEKEYQEKLYKKK